MHRHGDPKDPVNGTIGKRVEDPARQPDETAAGRMWHDEEDAHTSASLEAAVPSSKRGSSVSVMDIAGLGICVASVAGA